MDTTTARLVASLAREGLGSSRRTGGRLEVRIGDHIVAAKLSPDADPAWLHPGDLHGDATLDGATVAKAHKLLEALDLPGTAGRRRDVSRLMSSAAQHRAVERPADPRVEGPLEAWDRAVVDGDPWDPCDRARPGVRVRDAASWAPERGGRPRVSWVAIPAEVVTGSLPRLAAQAGDAEVVIPVHEANAEAVANAVPRSRPVADAVAANALGPPGEVTIPGVRGRWVLTVPGSTASGDVALSQRVLQAAPERAFPVRDLFAFRPTLDAPVGVTVREDPAAKMPGERLVGCAALLEPAADGRPLVLSLPGAARPQRFLASWVGKLLDGVVSFLDAGLAVPASGWGLIARFEGGRHKGFAFRGLGRTVASGTSAEIAAAAHQHVVQRHVADLVHALGLGRDGWRLVRDAVDIRMARTDAHAVWTALQVPHRCALRSRLQGADVMVDVPNPLR